MPEQSYDGGKILFYVSFVLLLLLGVMTSKSATYHSVSPIMTVMHSVGSDATARRGDSEESDDFDGEDETASKSMTG